MREIEPTNNGGNQGNKTPGAAVNPRSKSRNFDGKNQYCNTSSSTDNCKQRVKVQCNESKQSLYKGAKSGGEHQVSVEIQSTKESNPTEEDPGEGTASVGTSPEVESAFGEKNSNAPGE